MSKSMEVRNQYRIAEWSELITEQSSSGLNVREFCVQQGISEQAYYYGLRKMRQQVVDKLPQLVAFEPPSPDYTSATSIKIYYCGATFEVPTHNSAVLTTVLSALKGL